MQIELKQPSYQPLELARLLEVSPYTMSRWLASYETYTGISFPRTGPNTGRVIPRKDAVNLVRAAEISQAHQQKSLTYGLTVLFTGSEYSPQTSKQNTLLATLLKRIDTLEDKLDQQTILLQSLQKALEISPKKRSKTNNKTL